MAQIATVADVAPAGNAGLPGERSWARDRVKAAVRQTSAANRDRRWALLRREVRWDDVDHVVDLGGTAAFWRGCPDDLRPRRVTCVNLAGEPGRSVVGATEITVVRGDATDPPVDPAVADLVVSNSVIEHVGDDEAVRRFATVVQTNPAHVVQTPNRWFVVEPHLALPMHFALPRRARIAVVRVWDKGPVRRDRATATTRVDGIRLLDARRLARLFPEATVHRERGLGHTRSLVAISPMAATGRHVR